MKQKNITTYAQLEQYYIQKVIGICEDIGYSYTVWQEVVDNGVKVIEVSSCFQFFSKCVLVLLIAVSNFLTANESKSMMYSTKIMIPDCLDMLSCKWQI